MSLAILTLMLMAGLMAYVRFAPTDAALWQVPPATVVPNSYPTGATDGPQPMPGGAYAALVFPKLTGPEVLARLDAIALATPRTRRLAGSPEAGLITWETRSAFWGFPDYTTAQAIASDSGSRLYLVARLRFGRDDFGVNAARLIAWEQALGVQTGANLQ